MNTNILKHCAKKIFETATHAAVFAYVSKKVGSFMDKQEASKNKVRVETVNNSSTKPNS